MIRKSSYILNIPANVKVGIKKKNTAIWAKGPLGMIRVAVNFEATFVVKGRYLCWSLPYKTGTRAKRYELSMNNGIKKLLFNAFSSLNEHKVCTFGLVGRGYKITSSKSQRTLALELGFTGKKIVPLPLFVNVRVLNRYSFELVSVNSPFLKSFSLRVRNLRLPNPYTSKGIFLDAETIISKQGKSTQY